MGRVFGIIIAILFVFPLCGCFDYHEINNTAMVAGIGIDRGENGRYLVSVEIIKPASGESASPSAKVISEDGDNVEDCLKRLVNEATKELRFSHCKLILFSEEIATDGISHLVDGFLRDPEYRADLFLAVVKGKASEMLKTGEKESRISSYDFATVIQNSYQETGSVPPTRLYQFVMDGNLSILPIFEAKNEQFSLCGTRGLRDGKIFAELTLPQTQSVMLVSGEYQQGELLLQSDAGAEVPCQIRSVKVSKAVLTGATPTVCVDIRCAVRLTVLPEGFDISTKSGLQSAESVISKLLTEKIQKDWEDSVKKKISDVFGFSVYLYRHEPRLHAQIENSTEIQLKLTCSVELENVGFTDERIVA